MMEFPNDHDRSQDLKSLRTKHIAKKPKQRRLISVKNAQNLGNLRLSSKETKHVSSSGRVLSSLAIPQAPKADETQHFQHTRFLSTELLSRERIVYNEKAEPRKSIPRLVRNRACSTSLDFGDDESVAKSNLSSDDSLSDFIVNDSASESELRKPPPSMRRKRTVPASRTPRNRRNIITNDDDEDEEDLPLMTKTIPSKLTDALQELSLNMLPMEVSIQRKDHVSMTRGIENQSGFRTRRATQDTAPILSVHTPPASPSKPRLQSPNKSRIQIPQSPHRQSIEAFWTQDVINDWNDVHSPQKTQKIKKFFDLDLDDADLSPSESPKRPVTKSPSKRDKSVLEKKRRFDSRKQSLALDFLEELDQTITGGQLAALSKSNGGVKVVWSKTLNSTAGRAKWQREAIRTSDNSFKPTLTTTVYQHHASIELAEKVIDDEDRLLNVLAHEFCHLANFMVSNVKDQPHGKSFKEWAAKVTAKFPHKNIHVTTKHSYIIDYKYMWGCVDCGIEYKRHSKSIDPGRHTCGACKGKLVQTKPVPRAVSRIEDGKQKKSGGNPYQVFVKKWYATVKQEHADWKMKEIMSELARRYKTEKDNAAVSDRQEKKKEIEITRVDRDDAVIVISDDEVAADDQPLQYLDEQLTALVLE